MPPKSRKSVVVDILDKVLDTASLPHSVDIASLKQEIEEQLRLLNIRAPIKQLGKGDSVESRKLVLLEHSLRSSKHDVSLKTLASAVGIKVAAFESLSFRVSQYMDVAFKSERKARASFSQPSSLDSQSGNPTKRAASTSTIPALSIRLGSQVHDSHGYAQRAQKLLKDMEDYITSTSTISSQKKRGYLQDMQRSRAAYEAACFYLVARGRKMRKIRGDDNVEQEEADAQLTVQDIIDASSSVSASEFRDIMPTVEKFASELEDRQKKDSKQPASGGSKRKRGRSRKNAPERGEPKVDEAARALLEGVEGAATSDTKRVKVSTVKDMTPVFVYNPKFLEWKKRKLQETCDEMKAAIAWEKGTDMESISDGDALKRAADEILRRHGLVD